MPHLAIPIQRRTNQLVSGLMRLVLLLAACQIEDLNIEIVNEDGSGPRGFFIQGASGNHLVALEEGRVYEAYANRGAQRGHISFMIEHGVAVKLPPVPSPLSSP